MWQYLASIYTPSFISSKILNIQSELIFSKSSGLNTPNEKNLLKELIRLDELDSSSGLVDVKERYKDLLPNAEIFLQAVKDKVLLGKNYDFDKLRKYL